MSGQYGRGEGYPHSKRRCRLADASGRRLPSLPGTMPRLVIALALLASVSISIAAYAQQPRVLVFSKTDRKSTRLNSSHSQISYAVFCLKKKNTHSLPTNRRRLST